MYKFAYFVLDNEGMLVDSMLEDTLERAAEEESFSQEIDGTEQMYKDVIFRGDPSRLVPFSQLIPIPMQQTVASIDYPEIARIIQNAWTDDVSGIDIQVRSQEEYIDHSGRFYPVVLCMAQIEDMILSIEDLPQLKAELLEPIELIIAPTGMRYKLADQQLGNLRRLKHSLHVFIDHYVARADLENVLDLLGGQHKMSSVEGDIKAVFGAAEWFATDEHTQIVKLIYFLEKSETKMMLDGSLERILTVEDLNAKFQSERLEKYSVLSTSDMMGVHSLRHSLKLAIKGPVNVDDLSKFEDAITATWARVNPGLTAIGKLAKELVGANQ